ncbi:aspartic peptidase domain-containing protein [Chiua virens]|nr:aspartic peptidase domain-containing protein [Chiua virens]
MDDKPSGQVLFVFINSFACHSLSLMLPLSLLLFTFLPSALAVPNPAQDAGSIHIPIVRRASTRVANLPHMVDAVRAKYGYKSSTKKKRSVASAALTDEQNDSSYSAVVSVGTPAQNFNLILDTGSSDLWVATTQCDACGSGIPLFNPSKSSSYKNGSSTVDITYGSGDVAGYTSQDTVTFTGFSMTQVLLSVSQTSSNLLSNGLSGIMGLGWESISALQTTPFWQTLYSQNKLSSPVFSFYLERYVNDAQVVDAAPGGTFTLGGTNTSLYSGTIEFINMPSGSTPSYWLQQVKSITVLGNTISVSSSESLAAIDTGTTLIGGPSDIVAQIWSSVPNSAALTGQYAGLYAFPCSSSVTVSISFGGTNWAISTADMNLGTVSGSGSKAMCAGGIFDIGTSVGNSNGLPSWIVGDTFLKNVYSVFQANPAAVGFAQLASGLSSTTNSSSGTIPFSSGTGVPLPSSSSSSSSSPFGTGTSGVAPSASLAMSFMLAMVVLAGWCISL